MGDLGATNGHNGHLDLPDKDSRDIYLVESTPEEVHAQSIANSSEWKGALPTVDSYLRREQHLANQDLTKDGLLTPWSLIYHPEGGRRQALCGCETIKKRAVVFRNGKVEEVVAHGVCSVFNPPEKRGRGYVRRMMVELSKILKHWQMEAGQEALCSVLWSDIGKKFYALHGWKPFPSAHISLPAVNAIADGLPSVRLLKSEDLSELCAIDAEVIRQRIAKATDSSSPTIALVPNFESIAWHHAREEFVGQEVFGKTPMVKGAITGELGSRIWCYYARVWKDPEDNDEPSTFHILRLAYEDAAFSDFVPAFPEGMRQADEGATVRSVAALLAAAQSEAANWDMDEVHLWNPSSSTLAAAQLIDPAATVQERASESIASLLWYGESDEQVEWICNEKYGKHSP